MGCKCKGEREEWGEDGISGIEGGVWGVGSGKRVKGRIIGIEGGRGSGGMKGEEGRVYRM